MNCGNAKFLNVKFFELRISRMYNNSNHSALESLYIQDIGEKLKLPPISGKYKVFPFASKAAFALD